MALTTEQGKMVALGETVSEEWFPRDRKEEDSWKEAEHNLIMDSPAVRTCPRMTSDTSCGEMPALFKASTMTTQPSSWALTLDSEPLKEPGVKSKDFNSAVRNMDPRPFTKLHCAVVVKILNCNGVRRQRQIRGPKIRANMPPKGPCWCHRVCHLGAIVVAWAARWRLGVGRI